MVKLVGHRFPGRETRLKHALRRFTLSSPIPCGRRCARHRPPTSRARCLSSSRSRARCLDALFASFSDERAAVSDLIVPSPPPSAPSLAHDAGAGSPESVTSRATPPGGEVALSEIERFLMQEWEAEGELGGEVERISVDQFFDALYDGGEEGKDEGEAEAGASTDADSGRDVVVEVVTPEVETVQVDGDDPVSKKKRRYVDALFSRPPVEDSRRRVSGRGGKGRRLGLKKSSGSAPATSSPVAPTVYRPPTTSSPAAPTPTSTAPEWNSPAVPANSSPTAPGTSFPAAPSSSMPPWAPQGAGWRGIPPNLASLHANPQDPNSWYVCFDLCCLLICNIRIVV